MNKSIIPNSTETNYNVPENKMPNVWLSGAKCEEMIKEHTPFTIHQNTFRNWAKCGLIPMKRKHNTSKVCLYNPYLIVEYLMKPFTEEIQEAEICELF